MSDQIAIMRNALQKKGYRLTTARLSILEALVTSNGHISADALVDIVHQGAPGVGRMTVYRTLELLTELGMIRPVYQGSAAAHYVLLADGHHHHLICSSCQRVIEFDQCVLAEIERILGSESHFAVEGHLLEIYGRCRDCQ